jgi:hypothetical protein
MYDYVLGVMDIKGRIPSSLLLSSVEKTSLILGDT